MRWAGHVARIREGGGRRKCIQVIGRKARRKETTKKTKGWVGNNIKIDVGKIEWFCMDWIDLAQDRNQWMAFMNTAMNLRIS
jgi:hypothetical protein